jgi:WD40 repeat protein
LRKLVQVWDLTTGKEKFRLEAAAEYVFAACFSPDGRILATGGYKRSVQLWDMASGEERRRLAPTWFEGEPAVVGFSVSGKQVYAADVVGNLGIWEVANGGEISRHGKKGCSAVGVRFMPGGRIVAWGAKAQVLHVWEPLTGVSITPPGGHIAAVHALGFRADGKTLASLDTEGQLLRWDATSGNQIREFDLQRSLHWGHGGWMRGPAVFAPDGGQLVLYTDIHGLLLFDSRTGERLETLARAEAQRCRAWDMAFSADGSKLGAFPTPQGPFDRNVLTALVWDRAKGKQLLGLPANFARAAGIVPLRLSGAFSPDGKRVATVTVIPIEQNSSRTEVTGWDLATGKKLGTCKLPGEIRASPVVAGDGRSVVVTGARNQLFVCDLLTGRHLHTLEGPWESTTAGPVFSADGRWLAIATDGGKSGPAVHVFDWPQRGERHVFVTGVAWAEALAFSPDGRTLASGHIDTTILLWDLTDKKVRP